MVRGDLTLFPLLSVMQMLLSSGRKGKLSVTHPRGGEIWIEPGELVHAEAGPLRGDAALQLLCSLDSGSFTFDTLQVAPLRTLSLRRDAALTHMFEEQEGWPAMLAAFGDWERSLQFTPRWSEAQPVTQLQYRALRAVQPGQSIRMLLYRAGLPPRQLLETLLPFVKAGLLEVV